MIRRSTLTLLLPAALILGLTLACSKKPSTAPDPYRTRTAPDLLSSAMVYMQNGKWDDGRRMLRSIEERLPSSQEFPIAKLLIADSFFFGSKTSYPEALVEYKSYLNYFPRSERRDYALFRIALCHYASIENAERDQAETRKAMEAFQDLLREAPGSIYAVDAKAKITQCWRRLAESELMVGIFYVNSFSYGPAEVRLKGLLETYPDYVDRERAYYFLAEALRKKKLQPDQLKAFQAGFLAKLEKDDMAKLSRTESSRYQDELKQFTDDELAKNRLEARSYYEKLVESYPTSVWASRASDRLVEMGQIGLREELDS
ncbi:MAG: outer membrane protein assembly factor BamD [Holophaga sp.]|nr:outer membrane protein assembly factor BamD [Holophaga sp.]